MHENVSRKRLKITNPFTVIPSISFWSMPAIVLRLLPLGFLERERLFTESVLLLSFASSCNACNPVCTCRSDFRAADWRSNRFPLVSTLTICAGYLMYGIRECIHEFANKCINVKLWSYFEANIRHCSSGDGNRWSIGASFSSSDLLLLLLCPFIIIMLSVQSSDVLGCMDKTVWSADIETDVLWATRTRQLGATVSSPIASFDVHFRNSSTAAG